ncbi:MAG: serine hydrolase, partial [SAR202 cluster bacterium]|nr:serine hydrolase [SAR202 cluster bacterium]
MEALGASNTRTNLTLGKWHSLMKGLADLEPSRANDHILIAADVVRDSISYSDSLENNVASARDMGRIMERIYYGQIVSPKASHEMLEMLKGCASRTKIPRDLNPDVIVAHKIGG